jgi:FAD:protein FMN transferase
MIPGMLPSLVLAFWLAAAPPVATPPLRVSSVAFGQTLQVVISGLPAEAARTAAAAASAEVEAVEAAADPARPGSALAALNAAAGAGPQRLDPRLAQGLARALEFCSWAEGAHGPLGRDLYALWGLRSRSPIAPPDPQKLADALAAAACGRLAVDPAAGTATLAAGSAADLWGYAEGLAVDRAVAVLQARGCRNGLVRLGNVYRGFGPGPSGKGWPIVIAVPGLPFEGRSYVLRDRALAMAARRDRPLRVLLEELAPFVNQRTGHPVEGMMATLASTELALDAQAMAVAQFILGPREGQLRSGSLQPRPSVLWLQGTGLGAPLSVEYHWSEVARR